MIEVLRYQCEDGTVPLSDWFASLREARTRAKLEIRLRRVSLGMFGDIKPVGEGVLELREDIGPGFRIYVGRHGATLVILLLGGDKRSQDADIRRAKEYWRDWKRRNT
ncbi:hypothetical protein D3C86_1763820 [compost metagenome]